MKSQSFNFFPLLPRAELASPESGRGRGGGGGGERADVSGPAAPPPPLPAKGALGRRCKRRLGGADFAELGLASISARCWGGAKWSRPSTPHCSPFLQRPEREDGAGRGPRGKPVKRGRPPARPPAMEQQQALPRSFGQRRRGGLGSRCQPPPAPARVSMPPLTPHPSPGSARPRAARRGSLRGQRQVEAGRASPRNFCCAPLEVAAAATPGVDGNPDGPRRGGGMLGQARVVLGDAS